MTQRARVLHTSVATGTHPRRPARDLSANTCPWPCQARLARLPEPGAPQYLRPARAAIDTFAQYATGTVEVGLYKGNIFFNSLTGCKAMIYNEADSSMEASNGLNPVSSQGFAEIQSVEARMLARAGQIVSK